MNKVIPSTSQNETKVFAKILQRRAILAQATLLCDRSPDSRVAPEKAPRVTRHGQAYSEFATNGGQKSGRFCRVARRKSGVPFLGDARGEVNAT